MEKTYYETHKAQHLATVAAWQAKRRAHIATLKKYYGGCVDCGYNTHVEALEFDHRPGETKLFDLSTGWTRSWDAILTEMWKCDLVCANCHRVRTANRRAA